MSTSRRKLWEDWYEQLGLPATMVHPDLVSLATAAFRSDPGAVAVDFYGWQATYADLDRLSGGVAAYLRDKGIETGDRVGVYLQTSPHFVIAALGIWRAGGVVVTMNPMYREREATEILHDSGAVGVIASEQGWREVIGPVVAASGIELAVALTACEVDVLADPDPRVFGELRPAPVDGVDDLLTVAEEFASAAAAGEALAVSVDGDAVAVLCYTSGTTGPAKGAMLTHGALAAGVALNSQWLGTGPTTTIYGAAPLFHVVGLVLGLLHFLQARAKFVPGYRFVPPVALELFRQHRPYFFVAPPTAYSAMMATPGVSAADFSSFERMFAGGAMLPPAIVEEFEQRFGRYVNNGYGLTETCGACVFAVPNRPARVDEATQAMSNGVPLPGIDARIVGEDGAELPDGERGEIQVRGPMLAAGYWEKPEETAKAFHVGWFSTGDVGFFDDEGFLYCADRIKDMIVASGFKVWPGEVEQVLLATGLVREAAVVGVPDAYRGETVKAYVLLDPAVQTTAEELIARCRKQLAAFKVPSEIEIRDDLPRTLSGKVLRRELR